MEVLICQAHFYLSFLNKQKSNYLLEIDKQTFKMSLITKFPPFEVKSKVEIQYLLGIIFIENNPYLIHVNKAEDCGNFNDHLFLKVLDISFIPFKENSSIQPEMSNINELFKQGIFFSPTYHITSSLKKALADLGNQYKSNLSSFYDIKYFWNYSMALPFINQNFSYPWITPVIQGYTNCFWINFMNIPVEMTLISRRRYLRGGTRYYTRGLDDEGNVGNYVECEMLIRSNNLIYSYVQIRGSVPVFWNQNNKKRHLEIERDLIVSQTPLLIYLMEILKNFEILICLSLLSPQTSRDLNLNTFYKILLSEINKREELKKPGIKIEYINFDSKEEYNLV